MSIHLLEICPGMDVRSVKKLARKYAMTGGFELCLQDNLNAEELAELAATFTPALQEYPEDSAVRKTSTAYRVLELIARNSETSPALKSALNETLRA